jgi:ABC-2 type transport system permease protein
MHLLALIQLTIRRQLTYRMATISGLVTNVFFGLLRVALMTALYTGYAQERGLNVDTVAVRGLSLDQAISFTGITQAIIMYLSLFNWTNVIAQVKTGEIGSELLKPVDFYMSWFARDIGSALIQLLLRGAPIMLLYVALFDIDMPASLAQWLAFAIAMALALWVSFGWRFLANLAAFWTPDANGFARGVFGLAYMLSGFVVPLRFFPDWLSTIAWLTPFPSTVTTPVEAFVGAISPQQLVSQFAAQIAWGIGLTIACQIVLRLGVRKLVIQGG